MTYPALQAENKNLSEEVVQINWISFSNIWKKSRINLNSTWIEIVDFAIFKLQ